MAQVVAFALVDDDMATLEKYFWTLHADGYAQARIDGGTLFMHHAVVGREPGMDVSHENANPLDNRRPNLQHTTRSVNMLKTADRLRKQNTSGYRGVTRDNRKGNLARRWRGKVMLNGKTFQAARCATAEEAAEALAQLRTNLRVRQFPAAAAGVPA